MHLYGYEETTNGFLSSKVSKFDASRYASLSVKTRIDSFFFNCKTVLFHRIGVILEKGKKGVERSL